MNGIPLLAQYMYAKVTSGSFLLWSKQGMVVDEMAEGN